MIDDLLAGLNLVPGSVSIPAINPEHRLVQRVDAMEQNILALELGKALKDELVPAFKLLRFGSTFDIEDSCVPAPYLNGSVRLLELLQHIVVDGEQARLKAGTFDRDALMTDLQQYGTLALILGYLLRSFEVNGHWSAVEEQRTQKS